MSCTAEKLKPEIEESSSLRFFQLLNELFKLLEQLSETAQVDSPIINKEEEKRKSALLEFSKTLDKTILEFANLSNQVTENVTENPQAYSNISMLLYSLNEFLKLEKLFKSTEDIKYVTKVIELYILYVREIKQPAGASNIAPFKRPST